LTFFDILAATAASGRNPNLIAPWQFLTGDLTQDSVLINAATKVN
jgi:hypothetical protein